MIPILDLLLGIDNKLNKLSNLEHQFIPNETKIDALNKAQNKLILKKLGFNNNYQLGLDAFKKRYEDLQILIVPYEKIATSSVTGDVFNSYKSNVTDLTKPFFLPIDLYVLSHRGLCKDRILNVIEVVKHGDVQFKLNSPHSTPSFEYQETLATISNNTIYTYPDKKNTFTIDSLYITYLRYPTQMDIVGYVHLDNTPSTTVNCELDSYLENELLNLTCEELGFNTGNTEVAQSTIKRVQEDE